MPVAPAFSREQFLSTAKPITVKFIVEGEECYNLTLTPKEFGTGGLGWGTSDRLPFVAGDLKPECMVGINLSVVNSKLLPPRQKVAPAGSVKVKES